MSWILPVVRLAFRIMGWLCIGVGLLCAGIIYKIPQPPSAHMSYGVCAFFAVAGGLLLLMARGLGRNIT